MEKKTSTEGVRKWRLENAERSKILNQRAMIQHKFMLLTDLDYRLNDQQKDRDWQRKNRERLNQKARENFVPSLRRNRYEIDRERTLNNSNVVHHRKRAIIIWHYSYGTYKCECCGMGDGKDFLEVDHPNNDGNIHRRIIGYSRIVDWLYRNNLPSGFRILCGSCNHAIYRNNGVCPHKEHKPDPIYIPPESGNEKYIRKRLRINLIKNLN